MAFWTGTLTTVEKAVIKNCTASIMRFAVATVAVWTPEWGEFVVDGVELGSALCKQGIFYKCKLIITDAYCEGNGAAIDREARIVSHQHADARRQIRRFRRKARISLTGRHEGNKRSLLPTYTATK